MSSTDPRLKALREERAALIREFGDKGQHHPMGRMIGGLNPAAMRLHSVRSEIARMEERARPSRPTATVYPKGSGYKWEERRGGAFLYEVVMPDGRRGMIGRSQGNPPHDLYVVEDGRFMSGGYKTVGQAIKAFERGVYETENRAASSLPEGFEGFGSEVFDVQPSTTTEEPWRSARPLRGLRLGDRVVVGRQKFDVIRAFDDYTVMAQKPGAKRKAFNVWQNGPTVEVREQRGSPETTMAGPVLASAPYDQVQTTREGKADRTGGFEMNQAGHGSDVFGRNEVIVQFDDGPGFARAMASGEMEDVTQQKIDELRYAPGPYAKAFQKASAKLLPDEKDGPILATLEAAPLPIGYVSNALVYSDAIHRLPAMTKSRLYRLVKGGHVRVVKTWRPTPTYWLAATSTVAGRR